MESTGATTEQNTLLEQEVERIKTLIGHEVPAVSGKTSPDFLERFYGIFANDPQCDDVLRYSEERRERERAEANKDADEADGKSE